MTPSTSAAAKSAFSSDRFVGRKPPGDTVTVTVSGSGMVNFSPTSETNLPSRVSVKIGSRGLSKSIAPVT